MIEHNDVDLVHEDRTKLLQILKQVKMMSNVAGLLIVMPGANLPNDMNLLMTIPVEQFLDLFLKNPSSYPNIVKLLTLALGH